MRLWRVPVLVSGTGATPHVHGRHANRSSHLHSGSASSDSCGLGEVLTSAILKVDRGVFEGAGRDSNSKQE
eukprot:SM000003S11178  [mRNA]  locus=s3:1438663:1439029:+ [translate_table: standard]